MRLNQRLAQRAFDRCIPLYATLELNLHCNLRCVHCYNFDRAAHPPPAGVPLSPQRLGTLLGELADAGCLFVAFSGGEALLHPGLGHAVRVAREHRLHVTLKTNGTLLTPARAQALHHDGVAACHISLYGAEASTHDAVTGRPGSWARTVAGVHAALEAGLVVQVTYGLFEDNADDAGASRAWAQKVGVSWVVDTQLTERNDGTAVGDLTRVRPETLLRLYRGPLADLAPSPASNRRVQCGCGRSVCGVGANGDLYPCVGMPVPVGNLHRESFAALWQNAPALRRLRGLHTPDFVACAPCKLRPFCRRSSGVAYLNTGDAQGPDPGTCGDAQAAADAWHGANRLGVLPLEP